MTLLPERWLSVALVALPMERNMLGSALSELRRRYHIALLHFFGLSPLEADMLGSVLPALPRRYHIALLHLFLFLFLLWVVSSFRFHGFSSLCLLTLSHVKAIMQYRYAVVFLGGYILFGNHDR